ncbi:MAG: M48 family metallopeptidase [Oceanospirillaceae bacterium]|nr:M48 family metallopeptidase [Oceanospirillaceae bacterium]
MFKTAFKRLFKDSPNAFDFPYSIKRSQRKSLSIQIKKGAVRVLAPQQFPEAEILRFLAEKQVWIMQKLQVQTALNSQMEAVKNNAMLLCNGVLKNIIIIPSLHFSLIELPSSIELGIPKRVTPQNQASYIKKQLSDWYKQRAWDYLPHRLAQLSTQLSLHPCDVQIKQYKARWGSCNSKGVINLNSLLMMTPDFVIDYVIVHELCHLKHMNHSAQFWALVAKHFPAYKQAKSWLKTHQLQLHSFHQ